MEALVCSGDSTERTDLRVECLQLRRPPHLRRRRRLISRDRCRSMLHDTGRRGAEGSHEQATVRWGRRFAHGCTSSSSASERNFSPAPPSFVALPGLLGLGLADGGESTVTSALLQHGVLRCSWCAVLQHALLCCNMMCCVATCPAVLQHAPLHCKWCAVL